MKDKSIFISVRIIIYIAMSGIDRFVYHKLVDYLEKCLIYGHICRFAD